MPFTIDIHDLDDQATRLLADLHDGLQRLQPSIPPKWFYDDQGSELFEKITRLDEYYPTEAERALLSTSARSIVDEHGLDTLVELGAGVSDKTTALLDAMASAGVDPLRYVSFDISQDAIEVGAARLATRYPAIEVHGVVGDLDHHLDALPSGGNRLVALLGGTIGNYEPASRHVLLRRIASLLGPADRFLLGTDLVKDETRLIRAYDDDAGVTAAFNKNVLRVINTTLGAAIDVEQFEHRAVWNQSEGWIEMHLVAAEPVVLDVPGLTVRLDRGDHLLTEISAKFTPERLQSELADAGLEVLQIVTDGDYALTLAAPARPVRP